MPAQNCELAGDRDGGYLMAFCADPDEEGMQGPRRLRRRPGRFDEHRSGMWLRPILLIRPCWAKPRPDWPNTF